jgi:putative peptide zinc metalloprotease protein
VTTATPDAPRRPPHPGPAAGRTPAPDRPERPDGLELVGRFEGSGFKDPPYLVRRADGQVIQLSQLLYLVAEAADGGRDAHEIASRVSRRAGRGVSADNVHFLVERKLRPLGVLAGADGSTPDLPRRPPLLALRHRRPVLPERVVGILGSALTPLFAPPVVAVVLAALVLFDGWLLGFHGIAPGLRSVLYEPTLLLALVGGVIAATAFHELGHAAACRYGGARPGAIGAGLYLVWPAFYCDVTDAYRLDRRGRLRTDLGGVYFNGIVALLAGAAYFATGQEGVLLLAAVQNLTILQQLLPLLRFDGYYVLSDLTGVPDILSRIGPILRSLVPFRRTEAKVRELKPWVRVVVTAYVALLVPVLLLLLGWMVLGAPRVFATAFDSLLLHVAEVAEAVRRRDWSLTGLGALQVMALVLQCAGIALILARTSRSTGRRLARWSQGSRPRRAVALAGGAMVVAAIVAVWWPNGDYQPLRPGERGTIPEGISTIRSIPAAHQVVAPGQLGYAPAVDPAGAPAPTGGATGGVGSDAAEPPAPTGIPSEPAPSDGDEPGTRPADPPDEDAAPAGTAPPAPQPSATPGATPTPAPDPTPAPTGDNAAVATNTQDGALVFRLAFALQFIEDGVIDQSNTAIAQASCQACRTIAIAVQVLIATGDVHLVAPTNLAVALNEQCPSCATLAYAYQLVLALPNVVGLSAEADEKLKAILAAMVVLGTSDAPVDEIQRQLDALTVKLRDVVVTELVRDEAEDSEPPAATAPGETATPSPDSTAAPSPDSTAAPTPDSTATPWPDSTATPSPDSTATPSPDSTATPSPDSTAAPTPDSTATPSPDPTTTATPSPDPTTTATPEATATPTP